MNNTDMNDYLHENDLHFMSMREDMVKEDTIILLLERARWAEEQRSTSDVVMKKVDLLSPKKFRNKVFECTGVALRSVDVETQGELAEAMMRRCVRQAEMLP